MDIIQGEQRYQLIKLTLDSGDSIETTAEHPFYLKGKGWNPASSLKVGEPLQLHNGTTVVIKQIETGIRVEKVYNFTVANTHNYFVGEDGVLVHNIKKDDIPTIFLSFLIQILPGTTTPELPKAVDIPDTSPSPLQEKVKPRKRPPDTDSGGKGKNARGRDYPRIPPGCINNK
jgi:hypothetical protein